ncbi:MAG: hypothetical protein ACJZ42_04180 [Candidatus Thalassarchaeaceae archaeon]|jgi:hypothetical protein|nr:MAG: hypothetical protein CND84_04585 [Marine Group II euryarchaeote MED-G35]
MSSERILDKFLEEQPRRSHKSHRNLAKIVREAYPIGVPAMIMKSSTDRLGSSAGYSFHLGTPDEILRRIASWLITEAGEDQRVLWKLIPLLWKRHGREDVALSALLLANLDNERGGVDPWVVLASSINSTEPAEALLLSIEEVFRAGHDGPSDELLKSWCEGRLVESHLALISAFAAINADREIGSEVIGQLVMVKVPVGDSLLGRIRDRVASGIP